MASVEDLGRAARIVAVALESPSHDDLFQHRGGDAEARADAWLQELSKRPTRNFDWLVDATVLLEDGTPINADIRVEHHVPPPPLRCALALRMREQALDPRKEIAWRVAARRKAGLLLGHEMPGDSPGLRRIYPRYNRFRVEP